MKEAKTTRTLYHELHQNARRDYCSLDARDNRKAVDSHSMNSRRVVKVDGSVALRIAIGFAMMHGESVF